MFVIKLNLIETLLKIMSNNKDLEVINIKTTHAAKLDVTRSYLHADAMFFLRVEEALRTPKRKGLKFYLHLP